MSSKLKCAALFRNHIGRFFGKTPLANKANHRALVPILTLYKAHNWEPSILPHAVLPIPTWISSRNSQFPSLPSPPQSKNWMSDSDATHPHKEQISHLKAAHAEDH
jgi:hypothetical protein